MGPIIESQSAINNSSCIKCLDKLCFCIHCNNSCALCCYYTCFCGCDYTVDNHVICLVESNDRCCIIPTMKCIKTLNDEFCCYFVEPCLSSCDSDFDTCSNKHMANPNLLNVRDNLSYNNFLSNDFFRYIGCSIRSLLCPFCSLFNMLYIIILCIVGIYIFCVEMYESCKCNK